MKIIIATIKSWNIAAAKKLQKQYQGIHEIRLITEKEDLKADDIAAFRPDYIFFPHWSFYIPDEIFENWNCVVFHMTNLPFGRGGSPLQNLIVRGFTETKLSAIKVVKDLDAGPVYCKEPLSLAGSATEIFQRAAMIIFEKMIPRFFTEDMNPVEQAGEPVVFKRRRPEDGELHSDMPVQKIYDYIRMLDGEGYPPAFLSFGNYQLEFSDASIENGQVKASVRFVQKEPDYE